MKGLKMFKFIAGYIWTQIQTTIHKLYVLFNLVVIIDYINPPNRWKLYRKGLFHDLSKYRWSEAKHFAKVIFDLKRLSYGTEEYKKSLEVIKPAIELHYKINSHHPEYHKNGYKDMSYLDKLEMIVDWHCACKRHKDGNVFKSIEINQSRFNYSEEDKEWLISIVKILN